MVKVEIFNSEFPKHYKRNKISILSDEFKIIFLLISVIAIVYKLKVNHVQEIVWETSLQVNIFNIVDNLFVENLKPTKIKTLFYMFS